jgi:hypothetical protein
MRTQVASHPVGALLVGSVPLDDTDAVLSTAARHLGRHLRRIPDGETGTRTIWVSWQQGVFARNPDLEEEPVPEGQYAPYPRYRLRAGADPTSLEFGPLGYADVAIASFERFAAMKREGAIPPHMRFQISLPTPLAPLCSFAAFDERALMEPAYEAALLRDVDAIADALPHDEIAIQWDVAFEMGFVEDVPHPMFTPWFDDALGGSVERIARAGERVPAEIELGHHLCYGDFGHEHFANPADAGRLVAMANAIHAATERPIAWLHLPVPRDRTDAAFYAPLRALRLHPETELYLGLVHLTDGEDGTRARIAAAEEAVGAFGVATECGFGRRPAEAVAPLLDLHAAVADPVV